MGLKHGDVRNQRQESKGHGDQTFLDATTGEVVYKGPAVTVTQSVSERWCAHCQAWIDVRGIMGVLMFDHEHGHGKDADGNAAPRT